MSSPTPRRPPLRSTTDARGRRRAVFVGVASVVAAGLAGWWLRSEPLPDLGSIPPFALIEHTGTPLTAADLGGRIWIADFVFTRCPDVCPALTAQMSRLQGALAASSDPVELVSFTVDPTHDTPEVLRDYARRVGAGSGWRFVTGPRDAIATLLREGFRVAFADRGPLADPITHSDRFVLVDRELRIRGYYHGSDAADLARLVRDAHALHAAGRTLLPLTALPAVNATLNATSALLLAAGYAAIRRRRVRIHRACMVAAFAASILFLASYLTYHLQMGTTRFGGQGWTRPLYFTILGTHTVLAVLVPPLAILTLGLALRGRFTRHVRLARWTLPVWFYVSVTGVVVYAMLYHSPR